MSDRKTTNQLINQSIYSSVNQSLLFLLMGDTKNKIIIVASMTDSNTKNWP